MLPKTQLPPEIIQNYQNYNKALAKLEELDNAQKYSELEQEGFVQRFEFTVEMGWKLLQKILEFEEYAESKSPRETIRIAFEQGLIGDYAVWSYMLSAKNITSHNYNQNLADKVFQSIKKNLQN
jgi:nucleotidyltransferase substrate binding protein (TIGR01987 family)